MRKFAPYLLTILGLFISCNNVNEVTGDIGEVIYFEAHKCFCCWGWVIKIGNDTIKSDDGNLGDLVGYNIIDPIPVRIIIGSKKQDCSDYPEAFHSKHYYEIKMIELLE